VHLAARRWNYQNAAVKKERVYGAGGHILIALTILVPVSIFSEATRKREKRLNLPRFLAGEHSSRSDDRQQRRNVHFFFHHCEHATASCRCNGKLRPGTGAAASDFFLLPFE